MMNYLEILKKYNFTDQLGHPLENCQDFIDLLSELEVLREYKNSRCAEVRMFLERAVAPSDKEFSFRGRPEDS